MAAGTELTSFTTSMRQRGQTGNGVELVILKFTPRDITQQQASKLTLYFTLLCVSACVCKYVCVRMYVESRYLPFVASSPPDFLSDIRPFTEVLTYWLVRLSGQQVPEVCSSLPPQHEGNRCKHDAQFLCGHWRPRVIIMSMWQVLYSLNHLCSPKLTFLISLIWLTCFSL